MKADFKKLYRDLDKRRKVEGLSWRKFGEAHSIAPCTFTRMKNGRRLGIDNLGKVAAVLGVSWTQFVVD